MFAFVDVGLYQNQSSLLALLPIALFPAHLNCKMGSQLKSRSVRGGGGRRMHQGVLPLTPACQKKPQTHNKKVTITAF